VAIGAFTDFGDEFGYLLLDVVPGSYLVIDPIPTGIGEDRVPPDDAKPHFDNGMVASFTAA
jgi:hypothetical protein